MTGHPIADTPEALTPEWLTAALDAGGHLDGARVTQVTHQPVGTGQMCDCHRLELRFDGPTGAPSTLVAKLPARDETSRATARSLGSYLKEVRFYQEVAPTAPVRTAQVFHADIDPETARFVLLLEDLAPAVQGDQLAGCSPAVATAAVREIARLHAARWNDPQLPRLQWLGYDPDANRDSILALLVPLWAGFRDRYADDLSTGVLQAGEVLFAHLERYLRPPEGPTTLVHGDYRLDNLLLDPGDGQLRAVLDWQTCSVGPGTADVAYFVGAGLTADDRRPVEEDLVRRYHADLEAAGVTDYPWAQCWHDYRRATFAGLIMAVGASMLVERTPRGDQMFLTMASRHSQHALDLEAAELLRD